VISSEARRWARQGIDFNDLALRLMSNERRRYQNPLKLSKVVGVREGMTVVDLGCGPGFFTIPLASLVGGKGRVYAVDSNNTMLRHLRANVRKAGANAKVIRIMKADISKTKIPSSSADIVLLVRLLHDIKDKKVFFREVKRICRPAGRVIDLDWQKVRMAHGPPYQIRLSKLQSMKILADNGLRITGTFNPGRYHYGIIASPRA